MRLFNLKISRVLVLTAVLAGVFFSAGAGQAANRNSFGAIAYSPSTGTFGYSYGKGNLADAEGTALGNCRGADRQIVVWVDHGFAALAVNSHGYIGAAWSRSSQADACRAALDFAGGPACGASILCEMATGN